MMKHTLRFLALLLSIAALPGLFAGCSKNSNTQTAPPTGTTADTTAPQTQKETLDGKRVIFIGNSYTQAAHAVMDKGFSKLAQNERTDNEGFFYQLCKANGMDVTVTNWCFGGHNTTDTFAPFCTAGKPCEGESHPNYLTDRYYDYVAIQCYNEPAYTGDLAAHLQPIVDFFREANPQVKFLLLVPHMAYDREFLWAKDVGSMAEAGFIVCNWGGMLYDICKGNVQVPGAQHPYARPTFVISVDAKDGHHQNILAGYLTALMAYCAITGDSAVGQRYDFCDDPTINQKFDLEYHKREKYVYEPYTNFVEVFRSEPDMQGLQQLVDQYIAKYNN